MNVTVAVLLDDERYWYTCLRYVDLNPFRAHIVSAPEESRWSSYRVHAFGEDCDWLTLHPLYLKLGSTPQERQAAYRALCDRPLTDDELDAGAPPDAPANAAAGLSSQRRSQRPVSEVRLRGPVSETPSQRPVSETGPPAVDLRMVIALTFPVVGGRTRFHATA